MKKKLLFLFMSVFAIFALAACGSKESATKESGKENSANAKERVVTYEGTETKLKGKVEKVVVTDHNVAEMLAALNIKAVGVPTYAGKVAPQLQDVMGDATSIGEKGQPNLEAILKLKPDVIFVGDHTDDASMAKLKDIAPTIKIIDKEEKWRDNLTFIGDVAGKEKEAKKFIEDFDQRLAKAKTDLKDAKVTEQTVMAVRVRGGKSIMVYGPKSYLNMVLYHELGLKMPKEMETVKGQEKISIEKLSEINPDHLFVQFAEVENSDNPKILDELQKNPIWSKMKASQNKQVYVNVVEPLVNGKTGLTEDLFLDAATKKLLKK
ncbi:iron-siderophore ABC transporter substrate-binding protein [Bacillus cereus group sp. BfR-BA-01310]|uniref:iron-siderophore ABC transporter substrate-binding protein n=1 Tax=Bacillus cereus group sp. BfR-BA-01310 TaxID=2920287 RepID=UPI001F5A8973|nr:iron-siderophore ABC transporter substrate-binding protein [Bacillus cereus group sp. BfR-BA-01310]